jgi:hypothetical protein
LQYSLVWAKDGKDEQLVKAAITNRLPIPKAIQEKPTVPQHDLLFWQCFMDLCGTREMGQSLGFIPWTAVHQWAMRHEILDPDDFEELRYVVGAMDEFWINHFRKK